MKRLTKRSSKVKTKKVKTRENAVLIEQPLVSEKQIKEVAEQQQSKSRKTTAVRIKCMKCDTALIAPIPNVKQGFGAIRCQQCGMFDYFYGEYIIEDENYSWVTIKTLEEETGYSCKVSYILKCKNARQVVELFQDNVCKSQMIVKNVFNGLGILAEGDGQRLYSILLDEKEKEKQATLEKKLMKQLKSIIL